MAGDRSSRVKPHSQQRRTSSASMTSSTTTSPLPPASKLCSKTYKKASQLYLTRRLQQALVALEPAIKRPSLADGGDNVAAAPIATTTSTWRIKVWNLYVTLLSAIVELGPEEGKATFGQKEWKEIVSKVRDGSVWQIVVQTGYNGVEGAVDADVVYNLLVGCVFIPTKMNIC